MQTKSEHSKFGSNQLIVLLDSCLIKSNLLVKYSGTVGLLKSCKLKLKKHGIQGREGNRENLSKSRSRLKVLSVGELFIFYRCLFDEIGSLIKKAVFPLEYAKTALAQLEGRPSKDSIRWRLL